MHYNTHLLCLDLAAVESVIAQQDHVGCIDCDSQERKQHAAKTMFNAMTRARNLCVNIPSHTMGKKPGTM